jgi:diacylglycerol O-acyltransferase / wax synthase
MLARDGTGTGQLNEPPAAPVMSAEGDATRGGPLHYSGGTVVSLIPPTDVGFLLAESREQPMHVGGLQVFQLPEGAGQDWLRQTYTGLLAHEDLHPLFRRLPVRSVRSLGAWRWALDPEVDLGYHVRHSALPRPWRVRELLELTSRLHSGLLDRHRPLWEFHLIEGLEGGRFATYTKVHHALVDGVSAMRLLERSLSREPEDRTAPVWVPRPRPGGGHGGRPIALRELADAGRTVVDLGWLGPIAARLGLEALRDRAAELPLTAPRTIFNVEITGARRYAAQSWPIADLRAVASASGTTLNDVVLAMSSGALRRYLRELGALPDTSLVAMTPVSLRARGEDGEAGNAVGAVLCSLGTDLDDPLARLERVHVSMSRAKNALRGLSQTQVLALSAATMAPMGLAFVPGVRRVAPPAFNLVVSNVPGPTQPLYFNGARLEGSYPLSIPANGQALNITVTSYDTTMAFGLTGCRRNVPHLQRMLGHLETSLKELMAATGA